MLKQRLSKAGLVLPAQPASIADYEPARRVGNLLSISGQLPIVDGKLSHAGLVGADVSEEEAVEAAGYAVLNALSVANSIVGNDLKDVIGCFRLTCFVAVASGFNGIPKVANGASQMLVKALGDAGYSPRTAIGVAALPLNAPVEVELTLQLKEVLSD